MRTTQEGIDLIKRFESFRAEKYVCPAGYPTIGWGHVIRLGEDLQEISEAEGETLLFGDITKTERAMERLIKVPLGDCQWDALVSFTFNVGSGALQRSTLRQKVNREEHAEVPDEFVKWIYAGGRPLRGLVRRRILEATLYAGGGVE